MREAIGTVIAPCERAAARGDHGGGARAVLGADAFAAAWQRGRLAHPDDLVAADEVPAPREATAR